MTKFHVDLGEHRTFEKFKSLKKAVRWARAEYADGRLEEMPAILDDNGDQITVDWADPGWLTHAELLGRLRAAETSREQTQFLLDEEREKQARRDNELIRAGYIPVRALAPHLIDVIRRHEGGVMENPLFPRDFGPSAVAVSTTYQLEFRQFHTRVGKEQHPFITAMTALQESRKH